LLKMSYWQCKNTQSLNFLESRWTQNYDLKTASPKKRSEQVLENEFVKKQKVNWDKSKANDSIDQYEQLFTEID
jgi:hypothetical protein